MFIRILVFLCITSLGMAQILASPQLVIPDVSLEVTARQKSEGEIGKGLHIFTLECRRGDCVLTTLSLNQCQVGGSGEPVFYPKIERSSVQDGSMEVIDLGNIVRVRQKSAQVLTTLNFGYEKSPYGNMFPATRVTSFSGGFVKDSTILKRVITVEYVPLVGEFHYIDLDCAALLSGVNAP